MGTIDFLTPPSVESLHDIFNKYGSDKNSNFHNYSRQYEELLKKYRDKSVRLLEIGVAGGESLKIWRETFLNATEIVGVDIEGQCKKHSGPQKNIRVEIANATTKSFAKRIGNFDIIVDDGSHKNNDVISSFENLFPLVNDDGLYLVEDTICYKSRKHINKNFPHHLDYFAKFLPYLNQWRHDGDGKRDHCVDPFKIQKKTDNIFEYSIDKIEFGCSYIAVHKKIRKHWINQSA